MIRLSTRAKEAIKTGLAMAIVYAVSARVMSRVSAHLSNIASSVVQPYDLIRHGDEEA